MKDHKMEPMVSFSNIPYIANIPGSKSLTNRALVIAAQRMGMTYIRRALHCEDTDLLAECLGSFGGLSVVKTSDGYTVERTLETLIAPSKRLYVGGAGTPARFLLAFASMAEGETEITGNVRLSERPMGDILRSFESMGVKFVCLGKPNCLPIKIWRSHVSHTVWQVEGAISSQFTSSLLLLAAQQPHGPVSVIVNGKMVSRPYIEMTVQILRDCGIPVDSPAPQTFVVHPRPLLRQTINIEADASGMSYFLAAAAVTKTSIVIPNIGSGSAQGDVGFAKILQTMGCDLSINVDSVEMSGASLRGVDVDMDEMPDTVLTLAAVSALATGQTRVTNIGNLRLKECDRIHAAANELQKLGVDAEEGPDFLIVRPNGIIRPCAIETYDDHRVAMSFAILGLLRSGIGIANPGCVAKSFPGYWDELCRFRRHHEAADDISMVS